jgi:hypothetical protein
MLDAPPPGYHFQAKLVPVDKNSEGKPSSAGS